jgi:hypothetical protein
VPLRTEGGLAAQRTAESDGERALAESAVV